jgi:cell division protein FtsL
MRTRAENDLSWHRAVNRGRSNRALEWIVGAVLVIGIILTGYRLVQTQQHLETMQSELENAKQAVDRAKAQATELAKRTASQRYELQTKLDQATSEIKSAQSQLEDKQSHLGGIQSELENAKRVADWAKAQATELAKRNASLNSELEKTNARRDELQTKLDQAWDGLAGAELLAEEAAVKTAPSSEAPETASQPLTRADCDKAGMQWSNSANVCGSYSEASISASEAEQSTADSSSQPLTRAACGEAGMAWDDGANVCGSPGGASISASAGLTADSSSQPLTRAACDEAGMEWDEGANVCGSKSDALDIAIVKAGASDTSSQPLFFSTQRPTAQAAPDMAVDTSGQPLTRTDCSKAGMKWNDSTNVCGVTSEGPKAQAAPVSPKEQSAKKVERTKAKAAKKLELAKPKTANAKSLKKQAYPKTGSAYRRKAQAQPAPPVQRRPFRLFRNPNRPATVQ